MSLSVWVMLLLLNSLAFADQSTLCDRVFDNQISFSDKISNRDTNEFSFITWNAFKFSRKQFMPDLISLSKTSDLIFLQEAMHSTNLQNNFSTQFSFSFSFFKSFCDSDKKATGVMTMSRLLLKNNMTLVSPDTEPFTHTPKVSGYSAVEVPEIGLIHLINTHGLNFNTGDKFNRQIESLAEFIKDLDGPVIWAGDFNTWNESRKSFLDEKANELGLQHLKPSDDNRFLILDHVYTRGLEVLSVKVLNHIKSSDHKPIEVIFKRK